MSATLSDYQTSFENVRRGIQNDPRFKGDWICTTGIWPDTPPAKTCFLKLFKSHWTADVPEHRGKSSAIFFSTWMDSDFERSQRMRYNIHALKLRGLPGYALESRKFAASFRAAFASMQAAWPNVSLDFGPQTLMEGFVEVSPATCEALMMNLTLRFLSVAPLIEGLLEEARR